MYNILLAYAHYAILYYWRSVFRAFKLHSVTRVARSTPMVRVIIIIIIIARVIAIVITRRRRHHFGTYKAASIDSIIKTN